jgi:NADH-quinone oxidoreductase subunit G
MSLVNISIDDTTIEVADGSLLIDVLLKNGIKIPHFCYHEALGADGNCRMCMVAIEGQKRPQIACDTFVKEGMKISTQSPAIKLVQQDILELELLNHPIDCPICDQAGECKLQDYYMDYGLSSSHIEPIQKVKHQKHIDLGSNVILDQERCVLCARCTRFTSDITKTHELGIIGRGDKARVSTMPNRKLDNPYAMNVVDLCPVGALTSKDFRFAQRVWFLKSTDSICHGCDRGCNIHIDHNREKHKEPKIYRFRPRVNESINGHFICDEGRLSYKALQENRQRAILYEGKSIDKELALSRYKELLAKSKNITILVDANLYNEELEDIVEYAKEIDASIYSPLDIYIDEEFKDDWLKSSQRASNAKGVEGLDITTGRLNNREHIDLLISFNYPQNPKADNIISFQTHQGGDADLIFPIAPFSESSGSITNRDGAVQECQKAVDGSVYNTQEWLNSFR